MRQTIMDAVEKGLKEMGREGERRTKAIQEWMGHGQGLSKAKDLEHDRAEVQFQTELIDWVDHATAALNQFQPMDIAEARRKQQLLADLRSSQTILLTLRKAGLMGIANIMRQLDY